MKIIISRKGFDSAYGEQPSPIMPDGTLLSLPIPVKEEPFTFGQLKHGNRSYSEIIRELRPRTKWTANTTCHLDPDIRQHVLPSRENGWKGLFGQSNAALTHLDNQDIGVGDLFLFFGWYRQTEFVNSKLRYVRQAPQQHIIFGYLQIGEVYRDLSNLPAYANYHPHSRWFDGNPLNCIYEAADKLSIANDKPGYGCFNYSPARVLTKPGLSRSKWQLPDAFRSIKISYHNDSAFKSNYFQSAAIGQEFVIEDSSSIMSWVADIIGV